MPQSPEAVVRRLIEEGYNRGNPDVADELISADLAEPLYNPDDEDVIAGGAEAVKHKIISLRQSFSDFHVTLEDLAVAGDTVWVRMTATGTNDGPFMGHPPTGRSIRITVMDALRVEQGRVVEHWGVADMFGSLRQLGLAEIPAPATARSSAPATADM